MSMFKVISMAAATVAMAAGFVSATGAGVSASTPPLLEAPWPSDTVSLVQGHIGVNGTLDNCQTEPPPRPIQPRDPWPPCSYSLVKYQVAGLMMSGPNGSDDAGVDGSQTLWITLYDINCNAITTVVDGACTEPVNNAVYATAWCDCDVEVAPCCSSASE